MESKKLGLLKLVTADPKQFQTEIEKYRLNYLWLNFLSF